MRGAAPDTGQVRSLIERPSKAVGAHETLRANPLGRGVGPLMAREPIHLGMLPAERVTVPGRTPSDGLHDISDDRHRARFERASTANAGWKTHTYGIDHDDAIPPKIGRKQDVDDVSFPRARLAFDQREAIDRLRRSGSSRCTADATRPALTRRGGS